MLKCFLIVCMFLVISMSALAITEDKFQFDDPKQSALFLELTKELRCPKCQNQNIADSDAMIAVDLKRKVHQLVQKGYDKDQVVDYMKQRYGDFVFYQPPVNAVTIWLWLIPLLFIVLTMAGIVLSRKKQVQGLNEVELEKAQALLEREE